MVAYFPSAPGDHRETVLRDVPAGASFAYEWYDPRTGDTVRSGDVLTVRDGELLLPRTPSADDWLLALRARR